MEDIFGSRVSTVGKVLLISHQSVIPHWRFSNGMGWNGPDQVGMGGKKENSGDGKSKLFIFKIISENQ